MAENSSGNAVVLRHGTVLTMDANRQVLTDADVLVVGDRIAAVGSNLEAPPGAEEIDATGGIVMPGMIDTHRHMWQTAMRGYGADWTLTQYFVWYYLEHGRIFRPEDIYAGNLLERDRGHRRGRDHHRRLVARAAVGRPRGRRRRGVAGGPGPVRARVRQYPGRPVGLDRPAGGAPVPGGPSGCGRRPAERSVRLRRHRRSLVPGAGGVRGGPRPRAAGDHPRRGLGRHQRRRHPADPRERLRHPGDGVRPCRHPERGLVPADRGERRLDLGVHRVRAERRPGLPAHLAGPPLRHPRLAVDGHQRLVERRPVLRDARDPGSRPRPGASRSPCRRRNGHLQPSAGRARGRLGDPRRGPGAGPRRPRQPGGRARRPT